MVNFLLSLDEVIEFAKTIDNWNFHGDYYKGFRQVNIGDPTIYLGVERISRLLRKPRFHVWVQSTMNCLANYTHPKVQQIYKMAEDSYIRECPLNRQDGLLGARKIISLAGKPIS